MFFFQMQFVSKHLDWDASPRQNCKDLTRNEISAVRSLSHYRIYYDFHSGEKFNGIKTISLVFGTPWTIINFSLEHEIQRAQKCRLISKVQLHSRQVHFNGLCSEFIFSSPERSQAFKTRKRTCIISIKLFLKINILQLHK